MISYRYAIVCLVALITLAGCSESEAPINTDENLVRPAKIVTVESLSGPSEREFPGVIEASQKSELAFRVGGLIQSLPAQSGKNFKKGQVLAKLDPAPFQNRLLDAQAQHKLASSNYQKIIKLKDKNYISPSQVDSAEANLKAAQAALATAKDNLEYSVLTAPFNGVVAKVMVDNHQVVAPNQMVLQFQSQGDMDVRFNVPENLLTHLRRIEHPEKICSEVYFNDIPKAYKACFKEFESVADPTTRSYAVVNTMPYIPDFPVLPGMSVKVKVNINQMLKNPEDSSVLVPVEAVFQHEGKSKVWVVDGSGKVHRQEVQVERVMQDKLVLSAGLQQGQQIVAAGVSYLDEGMQVTPLNKERGL